MEEKGKKLRSCAEVYVYQCMCVRICFHGDVFSLSAKRENRVTHRGGEERSGSMLINVWVCVHVCQSVCVCACACVCVCVRVCA